MGGALPAMVDGCWAQVRVGAPIRATRTRARATAPSRSAWAPHGRVPARFSTPLRWSCPAPPTVHQTLHWQAPVAWCLARAILTRGSRVPLQRTDPRACCDSPSPPTWAMTHPCGQLDSAWLQGEEHCWVHASGRRQTICQATPEMLAAASMPVLSNAPRWNGGRRVSLECGGLAVGVKTAMSASSLRMFHLPLLLTAFLFAETMAGQ